MGTSGQILYLVSMLLHFVIVALSISQAEIPFASLAKLLTQRLDEKAAAYMVSKCLVLSNRGLGNQEISLYRVIVFLHLPLKNNVIHSQSWLETMPLAGLDEEHLGLPKQSRAVFSVESRGDVADGHQLVVDARDHVLFAVTQDAADEGVAVLREPPQWGEPAVGPLLQLERLQPRQVLQVRQQLRDLGYVARCLVLTHQHLEAKPAEHVGQAFCR